MHVLKRFAHAYSIVASWVRNHLVISGIAAAAALFVLYSLVSGNSGVATQTTVVVPGDFIETISVSGTVTASEDVTLGFIKGGRITSVYATPGQRIEKGALLASVENADDRAVLSQRQAALESARARYAQVAGGTRPEELAIAESDAAAARNTLVTTLKDAYRAADDAVRNKTNELFENPRTTASFIFAASNSRYNRIVTEERKELEYMLTQWRESADALSSSSNLETEIAQTKSRLTDVAEFLTNLNLALADAEAEQGYVTEDELAAYINDVGTARDSINTVRASVNTDESALVAAQKNLALKKAGSTPQEIAIEAADVRAAEANLLAAQAEVNKTLIVAPFSGIVSKVDAKLGATASADEPLISILSQGSFEIEAYVPEINIAKLSPGDFARVTLDAYGEHVAFSAMVGDIDLSRTVRDGVSTYKTTLYFTEADDRIRSGMTANVEIKTEEKQNTLVIPSAALITPERNPSVALMRGGERVVVPVVVGLQSLGQVEILSGISAGDTIVLNP